MASHRRRPHSRRGSRPRPRIHVHIVAVRRVSRVYGAGRRYTYAVLALAGDGNGALGAAWATAATAIIAAKRAAVRARMALQPVMPPRQGQAASKKRLAPAAVECNDASLQLTPGEPRDGLTIDGDPAAVSLIHSALTLAGIRDAAVLIAQCGDPLNTLRAAIFACAGAGRARSRPAWVWEFTRRPESMARGVAATPFA